MVDPAEQLTTSSAREEQLIRFEQPLTERMRTFLRIELLFQQAAFHIRDRTYYGTRAAVASLLEILAILGRGDARAEVLKELERHSEMLGRYRRTPGVDTVQLDDLIQNLGTMRKRLAEAGALFMNPLKQCDFLSTIRHRSAIPGGTCAFDLPDYAYWLHLPYADRAQQLEAWLDRLRPIYEPVSELLWLTRETNEPTYRVATGGLYQYNLPRNEHFNMVRVLMPHGSGMFPEISAGQHRFTVRFLGWQSVDQRPTQIAQDVRFLLALC